MLYVQSPSKTTESLHQLVHGLKKTRKSRTVAFLVAAPRESMSSKSNNSLHFRGSFQDDRGFLVYDLYNVKGMQIMGMHVTGIVPLTLGLRKYWLPVCVYADCGFEGPGKIHGLRWVHSSST